MAKANVHLVIMNVIRCACWAEKHWLLNPRGKGIVVGVSECHYYLPDSTNVQVPRAGNLPSVPSTMTS